MGISKMPDYSNINNGIISNFIEEGLASEVFHALF